MSAKFIKSFFSTDGRSAGYCSRMARMKTTTSWAPSFDKKSMSTWTTDSAMSGNFAAHWWIAWMSMVRYSVLFSRPSSRVRTTSRLSTCTTSSMFRGPTSSRATSRVFLQMSMFGDARALRRSMSTSWSTLAWCLRSSEMRVRTMSLTLLSLCEFSRPVYVEAAARIAVGADDRDTRVQAASYETAAELELSMLKSTRTKRAFCAGSLRQTLRVSSSTQREKPSPNLPTSSMWLARNSTARSSASLNSMRNALRRDAVSVSRLMKASMSCGPSGRRRSPKLRWM
mmetsp:Transcript_18080/g.52819  ORF Transcript_18080/g.52819 Transcript_18080/m.52819 type:complete len:284 (+) Transcript_18080:1618-2469(+)